MSRLWPSANAYVEAIQDPGLALAASGLRDAVPVLTRLGLPVVASGNFAYVFQLNLKDGASRAVKCFARHIGDREARYIAIDDHLEQHQCSMVADFEYLPDGILVAGAKYPVLVMEWIRGNTLDVYIGELLATAQPRDGLIALAEQWLLLIRELRGAGIAHGDLQHGNVLVTRGGLKLVDLDGMYVPKLKGTLACENGHLHYQHPRRSSQDFDSGLDSFAALVIYTSLVAIAERPTLWHKYHDDNLIFVRSDFDNPAASSVFAELGSLGGRVSELSKLLADAARGPLASVPIVTDLFMGSATVPSSSTLPAWMRPDVLVDVSTKSRAAHSSQGAGHPTGAAATCAEQSAASFPATAPGITFPSGPVTSGPLPPTNQPLPPPGISARRDSLREFARGVGRGLSAGFLSGLMVWALLLLVVLHNKAGAVLFGVYCGVVVLYSLVSGFQRLGPSGVPASSATRRSPLHTARGGTVRGLAVSNSGTSAHRAGSSGAAPTHVPSPSAGLPFPGMAASSAAPVVIPAGQTSVPAGNGPFVGSQLGRTYHRPSCSWAHRIQARNRVQFSSSAVALARGYRKCTACYPP